MNKYVGETFLSRLYRDMHTERSVIKSSNVNDSKYEKIRKYLSRIERVHKELSDRDRLDLIKKFYYDKYVIKKENISDDFFKYLEDNALNRGFGHIRYNKGIIDREKDTIINDQKKSLDVWIDYFVSEDSKMYPMWFKYYVFQSIVKLGNFDKEKNVFNQRTESTVSIFPDLNREALAMMYDYFNGFLNEKNYILSDKELDSLIRGGSFKKIYAYIIKKLSLITKLEAKANEGVWIKYDQGSDHTRLVSSLEGKGTGWCTAGEATAKEQLDGGDFYVYYSYDLEENPTIPRIAIRMDENSIAEIRGVAGHQNIEPEMVSVVEEKLKEFPDGEIYKKKTKDMEILTKIYKKHKKYIELSKEELRFLYEIDGRIQSFGYENDPRIEEIIETRNKRKDLCIIFDCHKDQIILKTDDYNEEDILTGKIIYYEDDLDLYYLKDADNIILPKYVGGWLNLNSVKSAKNLTLPQYVGGLLDLSDLEFVEKLTMPNNINGVLYLGNLKSARRLIFSNKVLEIFFRDLLTIEGLELPEDFDINKLNLRDDLKQELRDKKETKKKIKTVCIS